MQDQPTITVEFDVPVGDLDEVLRKGPGGYKQRPVRPTDYRAHVSGTVTYGPPAGGRGSGVFAEMSAWLQRLEREGVDVSVVFD